MSGAGLRDVVAVESHLSAIVDDALTYRGIPIGELFAQSHFQEVTYLLWFGRLPTVAELAAFRERLAAAATLPGDAFGLLRTAARNCPDRMLEAGVIGLALAEPRPDDPYEQGVRLVAGLPLVAAAYDRLRRGMTPVHPRRESGSIAASFLAAWRGEEPKEWEVSALDRGLVLVADHELNASTFTARVAASTGADLAAAVLAGVATYGGQFHGGALRFTGELLVAETPEAAAAEVVRRLDAGERIPGFGHPVYRRGDPRVPLFRVLAEEVAAKTGERRYLAAADRIEEVVIARTRRAPNMDLPAAALWLSLGIPPELLPAIFALGRMAGWVAHVLEQSADNRLIRPRARYAGLTDKIYVPIEERG